MNLNFIVAKGDLQTMICPNCSQYNDDEAHFCWSCGYSLNEKPTKPKRIICSNCSSEIRYEDVFCSKCGKRVVSKIANYKDSFTPPKIPTPPPPPINNQPIPPPQQIIYPQKKKEMPAWLIGILIVLGLCLLSSLADNTHDSITSTEGTARIEKKTATPIKTPKDPTLTPTTLKYFNRVSSLALNYNARLRKGPGTEYDSEGVIEPGTQVPVYGRYGESNWVLVDYEKNYWMNSESGQLENSIDELPVLATFTPTITPLPTATNTPIPTATKIPPVRLDTIYSKFTRLTALQFKEYKNTLPGKIVNESVKVGNVDKYGRVLISGDWSPLFFNYNDFCVMLVGMPQSESIKLDGGDLIIINARIKHLVGNHYYFSNCENTLVLEYINK